MIIVSQDKYNILNFDTTVNIGVEEITTLSDIVGISAQTNGNTIILGEYKTEERAKEIIEDFKKAYQLGRLFECIKSIEVQEKMVSDYAEDKKSPFIYEMPKE